MFQKCEELKLFDSLVKEVQNKPRSAERVITSKQGSKQEGECLKKKTLKADLEEIFKLFRKQMKYFLIHVFVKRKQEVRWGQRKESP